MKLAQRSDEQANSVMQQKQLQKMAMKITQLERYANDQNKTLSSVILNVNDNASRSNRSIPGMINTLTLSPPSKSSGLSTAQALITSLQARVADKESRQYDSNRNQQGPSRDGGTGKNKMATEVDVVHRSTKQRSAPHLEGRSQSDREETQDQKLLIHQWIQMR